MKRTDLYFLILLLATSIVSCASPGTGAVRSPSPLGQTAVAEKTEIANRVLTQIAMTTPLAPGTGLTLPTQDAVDSKPPPGIIEGPSQDFHVWEAEIKNYWIGYNLQEETVVVYAGAWGSEMPEPGRGTVYTLRRSAEGDVQTRGQILLPEGTGPVRITEIKGDYLVLVSEEGQQFYFYWPAFAFVDSLGDTLPTMTPLPTAEPWETPPPPEVTTPLYP